MTTTILVVEDHESTRNILELNLVMAGFAVELAKSGEEAIKILRQNPEAIDLILLDHGLPGMDGLETFEEIQEIVPYLPVVMLTSKDSAKLAAAFHDAGGASFLIKPPSQDEVVLKISEVLDAAQTRRERDAAEAAKEAAEQSLRLKSEFLSNVSHELRTPIMAIRGYTETVIKMVQEGGDRALILKKLGRLLASEERLSTTISNVLDLSRVEDGSLQYHFSQTVFRELVEQITEEVRSLVETRQLAITILDELPVGQQVRCDEPQLSRVLQNLFSNAIKFADEGSEIVCHLFTTETGIECSIANIGVGIPEGELEQIFEPFTQSTATNNGSGGTGLGLALCKSIITDHGGEIWAENAPERQVVFTFTLPS